MGGLSLLEIIQRGAVQLIRVAQARLYEFHDLRCGDVAELSAFNGLACQTILSALPDTKSNFPRVSNLESLNSGDRLAKPIDETPDHFAAPVQHHLFTHWPILINEDIRGLRSEKLCVG
jgi:hypothetical protein